VAQQQVGLLTGRETNTDHPPSVSRDHDASGGVEDRVGDVVAMRAQLPDGAGVQVVDPQAALPDENDRVAIRAEVRHQERSLLRTRKIRLFLDLRRDACEIPAPEKRSAGDQQVTFAGELQMADPDAIVGIKGSDLARHQVPDANHGLLLIDVAGAAGDEARSGIDGEVHHRIGETEQLTGWTTVEGKDPHSAHPGTDCHEGAIRCHCEPGGTLPEVFGTMQDPGSLPGPAIERPHPCRAVLRCRDQLPAVWRERQPFDATLMPPENVGEGAGQRPERDREPVARREPGALWMESQPGSNLTSVVLDRAWSAAQPLPIGIRRRGEIAQEPGVRAEHQPGGVEPQRKRPQCSDACGGAGQLGGRRLQRPDRDCSRRVSCCEPSSRFIEHRHGEGAVVFQRGRWCHVCTRGMQWRHVQLAAFGPDEESPGWIDTEEGPTGPLGDFVPSEEIRLTAFEPPRTGQELQAVSLQVFGARDQPLAVTGEPEELVEGPPELERAKEAATRDRPQPGLLHVGQSAGDEVAVGTDPAFPTRLGLLEGCRGTSIRGPELAAGQEPATVWAEVDRVLTAGRKTQLCWAPPEGLEGQSPHLGVVRELEAGDRVRNGSGRVILESQLTEREQVRGLCPSSLVERASPEAADDREHCEQHDEGRRDRDSPTASPPRGHRRHRRGEGLLGLGEPARVALPPQAVLAVCGAGPQPVLRASVLVPRSRRLP